MCVHLHTFDQNMWVKVQFVTCAWTRVHKEVIIQVAHGRQILFFTFCQLAQKVEMLKLLKASLRAQNVI